LQTFTKHYKTSLCNFTLVVMTQELDELSAELGVLGEPEVRSRLAHGSWNGRRKAYVEEWLRLKEAERESIASNLRDAREEETLSIAKEANRLASDANIFARIEASAASRSARYAMYAAIIAAISAVIAIKDEILILIFGKG
jgi:hypothetical protein